MGEYKDSRSALDALMEACRRGEDEEDVEYPAAADLAMGFRAVTATALVEISEHLGALAQQFALVVGRATVDDEAARETRTAYYVRTHP